MTSLADLPSGGASRVIYFGTPDIAVAPLRALVDAGCNVELVVTRPDVRRGRGNQTSACPVKVAALEMGLEVSHSLSDAVALVGTSNDLLGVGLHPLPVLPLVLNLPLLGAGLTQQLVGLVRLAFVAADLAINQVLARCCHARHS